MCVVAMLFLGSACGSDDEFQTMWLEMMIEHHTGAVEMAQAQVDEGQFEPAIELAREIAESQTREIDAMQALLDRS